PLLGPARAPENRPPRRGGGEEQARLPRRVARTHDMDVQAVSVRRFAAGDAVEDALPGQPVEPLDRHVPPRDAAGEDDRPRPQNVTAVEMDLPRRGVHPRDRPGYEDLSAEPPRLMQRTARQLVARDA